MKKYNITAANKEHFESLIKDYKNNGFTVETLNNNIAQLKSENAIIIINY